MTAADDTFTDLVLAIRHPADEIRVCAEVAYWLNCQKLGSGAYQLGRIVEEFDRLAPLVAQLREQLQPQSEAA